MGTERLKDLLGDLSGGARLKMTELLTGYQRGKEALAEVIAGFDAASVCRECGGLCCRNGKYRMNVCDVLARIEAQVLTLADFTRKPVCPYGTETGCTMEPGLRPADCILFICDAIEQKLPLRAISNLAIQERALRECIREVSCLTGEQAGTPLLLWAENGGERS